MNLKFLTHLPIIVLKSRLVIGKHQQFSYSFLKIWILGIPLFLIKLLLSGTIAASHNFLLVHKRRKFSKKVIEVDENYLFFEVNVRK